MMISLQFDSLEELREFCREVLASPQPAEPTIEEIEEPRYSVDDVSKAAVSLMDLGKRAELLDTLSRYGVRAITELTESQYNNFVDDLKEMGASIDG